MPNSVIDSLDFMETNKQADYSVFLQEPKQMTVQDLINDLMAIEDKTTLVAHETGEPVNYTCYGMAGAGLNTKDTFFIGAL